MPQIANALGSSQRPGDLSAQEKKREVQLRQASKDLEAIFMTQMFKAMEKTVPQSSLAGSKNNLASMMFSSVMGQALADQGGIGLAEVIYESLKDKEQMPTVDELNTNTFLENVEIFKLLTNDETE